MILQAPAIDENYQRITRISHNSYEAFICLTHYGKQQCSSIVFQGTNHIQLLDKYEGHTLYIGGRK